MHPHYLENLISVAPGIGWPAIPAPGVATMQAVLFQMSQAERMPAEWVAVQQMKQFGKLLTHALETVPLYQRRLPKILNTPLTAELWRQIPILTREELQSADQEILSTRPPKDHEILAVKMTSGSTGMPVKAYTTSTTRFFWMTNSIRDHLWHKHDFSQKIMIIRPELELEPGQVMILKDWGFVASIVANTGPSVVMNVRTDIDHQLRQLAVEKPGYILSLPTNLRALVQAGADFRGTQGIMSYGEVLDDDTRAIIEGGSGAPVSDCYSAQEVGYMTLQCPEANRHHILCDSVILEIVDDAGMPCKPGEVGRVVVTELHNFLAPLIRYAVGDYAVAGERCSCGRSYPVLDRILGRKRNMLHLPNGRQHWPSFPADDLTAGLPIKQFQLVQTTLDCIEVNLVVTAPLTPVQEEQMVAALRERLTYPFRISFNYLEKIPRSKGGKFEDFMTLL